MSGIVKMVGMGIMAVLLFVNILGFVGIVSAVTVDSVFTNPDKIEPGQEAEISLSVKNKLEDDVQDVSISLELENLPLAPYKSSSETTFDEIRAGRVKSVSFKVRANSEADSGVYKIPVKMNYKQNSELKEKTSFVSLIVSSEPDLEVSYEGNMIKGKQNELTLKVINSGLSKVKLLSLRIEDALGLKILSTKYVYMGDIDSDDFDSADFKILVSENAGALIGVPVKLSYRDALNNPIEDERQISVRAYTEEEAVRLGLIKKSNLAGIIIGVVAMFILYMIYRKLKKKLKDKRKPA